MKHYLITAHEQEPRENKTNDFFFTKPFEFAVIRSLLA